MKERPQWTPVKGFALCWFRDLGLEQKAKMAAGEPTRPDKFHVYTFDLSPLVIEQNIKPNNLGMTKIIITNKIIFNKRFKDLFDTFISFLNLKNCFHKQYMWFFFSSSEKYTNKLRHN